uniref:Uncharacterized protein n=1 Tax=Sphaerodactylus townsendi TaxID=933632 RepID=A0ACB8E6I6_9SAUR
MEKHVSSMKVCLWQILCTPTDPCHLLSPPCFTEEDKYSLEALRTIHKQMDDDKDGGIEVEESDEGILFPPKKRIPKWPTADFLRRIPCRICRAEATRASSSPSKATKNSGAPRTAQISLQSPQTEFRQNRQTLSLRAAEQPASTSCQLQIGLRRFCEAAPATLEFCSADASGEGQGGEGTPRAAIQLNDGVKR